MRWGDVGVGSWELGISHDRKVDQMEHKDRGYQSLEMWKAGHAWVLDVYRITRGFPREELYALSDQLRRAAVSVPTNMAEGYGRRGTIDKLRFYNIAQASLSEADYQLLLAHELGFADTTKLRSEAMSVARMLSAYTARMRSTKAGL